LTVDNPRFDGAAKPKGCLRRATGSRLVELDFGKRRLVELDLGKRRLVEFDLVKRRKPTAMTRASSAAARRMQIRSLDRSLV
jgi:hypothetical protein